VKQEDEQMNHVKYSDTKQVNEILILEKGEEEEEQMSSELRNDAAE
jgi:hypothetical protein